MKRVILESPFAAREGFTVEQNITYAKFCIHDCLLRGEAPIASHLLYTQPGILDDTNPDERKLGMSAGWAWIALGAAELMVVYQDHGISSGMTGGIQRAVGAGIHVEHRHLPNYKIPAAIIPNMHGGKPIKIGEIWKTRDGSTVEVMNTHDAAKDYTFHSVKFILGPDGTPRDFMGTVGPNGLYFPPLSGIVREHAHDLISRVEK